MTDTSRFNSRRPVGARRARKDLGVLVVAAAMVALGLAAMLGWPFRPARPPARAGVVMDAAAPGLASKLPETTPTDSPVTSAQQVFVDRADAVRETCDLDLDLRCDEAACAGVLTAPDLDRLGGWLTLVLDSPRFVLSTAARDLGVPPTVLPCGSAVGELAGDGGVTAVELPDGTEVWCTVSGSQEAGNALCDALAADRGHPEARFDQPGLRRLTFARSNGP